MKRNEYESFTSEELNNLRIKIEDLYINQFMTPEQVRVKLKLTRRTVNTIIDNSGIRKSESQVKYEKVNKFHNTCKEKYGESCHLKSSVIKNKITETNLNKYGVSNPAQSKEIQNKIKKTNLNRCGFENPMQSEQVKEKSRNTCKINYGVDYYVNTEESKRNIKSILLCKYGVKSVSQLGKSKDTLEIINDKERFIEFLLSIPKDERFKSDICEMIDLSISQFNWRLRKWDLKKLIPFRRNSSHYEIELEEFIKSLNIDNYEVNYRKLIRNPNTSLPLELDLYLPDHRLAIEFNGIYWHDKDNQEREELKTKLCEELGITLIHIWEDEYNSNKEDILTGIKQLIFNYVPIESITKVKYPDKNVYDIEVPIYNNFTLANGLVVHNSADSKQQLIQSGFDARIVSLDRTTDGYMYFKASINEKRIAMLEISELEDEIINLERNNLQGKIDHPLNGCFTADTRIKLVDGRDLSISELLIEQEYKNNYVYTFNEDKHKIEPKRIKKIFQTKLVTDLIKVTLDNDEVIFCTPEHLFMLRDGSYEEIQKINPGDSLMPLYTKYPKGRFSQYRMYYEPCEETWHFEHRRFCNNVIHKRGYVVHHCNYDKKNNVPSNLNCVSKNDLKKWHDRNKGKNWYVDMHRRCRNKQYENYLKDHSEYIKHKELIHDEKMKHISEIESTFNVRYSDLTDSEKASYGRKLWYIKNPGSYPYSPDTHKNLHEIHRTKCWITNGSDNKYINKTDEIPDGWRRGRTINYEMHKEYKNHKIKSIEKVHKACRVYDLEIEDNHNFALSAGVIVHNSKDIADSVAGALYNASQLVDKSMLHVLTDHSTIAEVNEQILDTRDSVISSLQTDLMKESEQQNDGGNKKQFMDLVMAMMENSGVPLSTAKKQTEDDEKIKEIKKQIPIADRSFIKDEDIDDSYFNHGGSDMLIW